MRPLPVAPIDGHLASLLIVFGFHGHIEVEVIPPQDIGYLNWQRRSCVEVGVKEALGKIHPAKIDVLLKMAAVLVRDPSLLNVREMVRMPLQSYPLCFVDAGGFVRRFPNRQTDGNERNHDETFRRGYKSSLRKSY